MTYSPGPHLAAFLDSIPAATRRGAVVVLADNGSTDGVPEAAAAERDNVQFLPTGGNLGYGSGVNVAARHLQPLRDAGEIDPEFFLISNPDVVFTPEAIDELIACARRWPEAAAVGPRIEEPDGSIYPSARSVPTLGNGIGHALLGTIYPDNPWSRSYRDNADMDNERTAGWLSGSCLLVRWDAFDAVGGFDERYFMYMEDVDLGDRLGRAGWRNVFCPDAVIRHAQGHSASSHPEITVRAHHDSAYRFMSDRLPGPWLAPVRMVLKIGLSLRGTVILAAKKRRQKAEAGRHPHS